MKLIHYGDRCESIQWDRKNTTKCVDCQFQTITELTKCMDKLIDKEMSDNLKRYNSLYSKQDKHAM